VDDFLRLSRIFRDVRVVVSEDGSNDGTPATYRAQFNRVGFGSKGIVISNPPFGGDRISKLAQARNVYLQKVQKKYKRLKRG
jgi:glycosyltransferase involved in cell wall biosynthesis